MIKAFVLSFALLLSMHSHAFALSCMPFEINAETVSETDIIFEGTVISAKEIKEDNNHQNMNVSLPFGFKINTIWKSDFDKNGISTDNITIMRNVYWGDGFKLNETYLVFADNDGNGNYIAGLCGIAIHSDHAGEAKEKLNNILMTNSDKNTNNNNEEKQENE